jgi:phage-related protein
MKEKEKVSAKSTTGGTLQPGGLKRVPAVFYRTQAGNEPVRDWLKKMPADDRRLIGEDIRTVEYGWPIGMPVCRPMGHGLHEVRTNLSGNRIARVFFYVDKQQRLVLLHGMIKKTPTTPEADMKLALDNKKRHEKGTE